MKIRYPLLCAAALIAALLASKLTDAEDQQHGPFLTFENPTGVAATYNTAGKIDETTRFSRGSGPTDAAVAPAIRPATAGR